MGDIFMLSDHSNCMEKRPKANKNFKQRFTSVSYIFANDILIYGNKREVE